MNKNRIKFAFGILSIIFSIYLLRYEVSYIEESIDVQNKFNEKYNPNYVYVDNLPLAIKMIELEYSEGVPNQKIKPQDSFKFLLIAKEFVKRTFYHGNSEFKWQENWICYLLSKLSWSHFNSIVSPYEVIKHSSAMCSQQTMVFTEIMKLKGYKYRYVYLNSSDNSSGHFCCEIWENNEWHFVDVDGEPDWDKIKGVPNQSIVEVMKKGGLRIIYNESLLSYRKMLVGKVTIAYSPDNLIVGEKMIFFQSMTKEISWLFPLIFGALLCMEAIYFSKRRV